MGLGTAWQPQMIAAWHVSYSLKGYLPRGIRLAEVAPIPAQALPYDPLASWVLKASHQERPPFWRQAVRRLQSALGCFGPGWGESQGSEGQCLRKPCVSD